MVRSSNHCFNRRKKIRASVQVSVSDLRIRKSLNLGSNKMSVKGHTIGNRRANGHAKVMESVDWIALEFTTQVDGSKSVTQVRKSME